MNKKKVVLITGVASYWGYRVASELSLDPDYHVLGLDTEQPRDAIPGLDFIQADIRNPLLVDLLKSEKVEIVCHLAFQESARPSEQAFDHNVIGTMKVLGACAQAGVKKIILKSSTAVYGAKAKNPAFLTEEAPLNGSRSYGSVRDLKEIEAFCNGYRGQHPDISLTILRFANVIGAHVNTPITRFLKAQLTPTLLGFDPIMQVIHEDDVCAALVKTIREDYSDVFNVAADPVMPLSKIMGLAEKSRLPVVHLLAYWGYGMVGGSGLRLSQHVPLELDYIRYRWVADTQKMRTVFGFDPACDVEEALRKIGEEKQSKSYVPEAITKAYDVERLRNIIERRRSDQGGDRDTDSGIEQKTQGALEGKNDE